MGKLHEICGNATVENTLEILSYALKRTALVQKLPGVHHLHGDEFIAIVNTLDEAEDFVRAGRSVPIYTANQMVNVGSVKKSKKWIDHQRLKGVPENDLGYLSVTAGAVEIPPW